MCHLHGNVPGEADPTLQELGPEEGLVAMLVTVPLNQQPVSELFERERGLVHALIIGPAPAHAQHAPVHEEKTYGNWEVGETSVVGKSFAPFAGTDAPDT